MPSRECARLQRSVIRFLSRRRAILVFVFCFFLWSTMFSLFWDGPSAPATADPGWRSGAHRLDNAKHFVAQLADRQQQVIDGPYTGRLTGYDTKKLLAVLLERLMSRLLSVESAASKRYNYSCGDQENDGCGSGGRESNNQTNSHGRPISSVDLLLGVQDQCSLDATDLIDYPQCDEKVRWMSKFWKSHSCYRKLGVDGSICSFIIYLSEVESFCPRLPSRLTLHQYNDSGLPLQPRTDMGPLVNSVLVDFNAWRHTFDFVKERVARLWPHWLVAAEQHHKRRRRQEGRGSNSPWPKQQRLRIHLHLGLLSKSINWKIAESSSRGGPLGELVQWADLIAALYSMGHDLRVTTETQQLDSMTAVNPYLNSPCLAPSRNGLPDLIFTDLVGLSQLQKRLGQGYKRVKCIMRILDTFGTQPQFNVRHYARRLKLLSAWGGRDLIPRQFFNLYPLTPDNSFLGFVVGPWTPAVSIPAPLTTIRPPKNGPIRREIALIYGKKAQMWHGMRAYLDVVNEFFEVHGTVADPSPHLIPNYVVNHHFVNPKSYQKLLSKARVYIGLGFPFEGPAPLEAIAQGTVFINPRFEQPLSRRNSPFFRNKPTYREITSQHPYIELFIGEPYSYLVNMKDLDGVRKTLRRVLSFPRPPAGRIPLELTHTGMIQRLAYYLRTQDFCAEDRRPHYGTGLRWGSHFRRRRKPALWPPQDSVQYFLGVAGESCEKTCFRQKRICEPTHFHQLNSVSSLHELGGLDCAKVSYAEDHIAPFRRPLNNSPISVACIFQSEPLLFSCAGSRPGIQRLCPCRNFLRDQSAICRSCDV